MKTKASVTILTLLLASLLTVALNATMVRAEENQVGAMLGRYCMYSATVFEDSIANIPLAGSRASRLDITPVKGNVDVYGARIEMLTTYPITTFPYMPLAGSSGYGFLFEYLQDPAFTYIWDWSTYEPISEATVWLGTTFPVTFEPGYDCERVWNPWITSPSVTQTLTIVFTPSTSFVVDGVEYHDFHGVHVQVQLPSTYEVSPTIDEESISATPPTSEQPGWSWDYNYGDGYIEVNWRGNPVAGTTYYFSVDVTVVNNLAPKPVFYKPSVGIGANFNASETSAEVPVLINVDLDGFGGAESVVTYSGTGDFSWLKLTQNENALSLPGFSSVVSFFNAGTWNETTHYVDTVSNSTVTDFYFSEDDMLISFNVTGSDGTVGFCRVTIPNELLWVDNPEQWQVWVNNTLIEDRKIMEDTNYTYIYFTYNHSIQEVQIKGIHTIPEFPTWTPILLILTVLSVAIAVYKRRLHKNQSIDQ